ncbi:MAG: hypothetical protein J1F11_01390 [Oscillospiraceae bacterium]|nr:hypothetical protein [Oscillospiraceae bacterium]
MDKHNVLDFIPFGRENAIPMSELAKRLNKDPRTARKLVFHARINGSVICSTCSGNKSDGYFRPVSAEDVLPYIRLQKSRISSAKAALKAAESFANDVEKE